MGECHCSNIAIMQLFHELKQQFPALPDHVVSQCIAQNSHDRETCARTLRATQESRPSPGAFPPPAPSTNLQQHQRHHLQEPRSKCVQQRCCALNQSQQRSSVQGQSEPVCSSNSSRNHRPALLDIGDFAPKSPIGYCNRESILNSPTTPLLVTTATPSSAPPISTSRGCFFDDELSRPLNGLSTASNGTPGFELNVNVACSPAADRDFRTVPALCKRTDLAVEPRPHYVDPQISIGNGNSTARTDQTRSYTSVSLTLRPPSSEPQAPIDIRSQGSSLTYSTSSLDPRGFQSRLQISIGPGSVGSVAAARIRPPMGPTRPTSLVPPVQMAPQRPPGLPSGPPSQLPRPTTTMSAPTTPSVPLVTNSIAATSSSLPTTPSGPKTITPPSTPPFELTQNNNPPEDDDSPFNQVADHQKKLVAEQLARKEKLAKELNAEKGRLEAMKKELQILIKPFDASSSPLKLKKKLQSEIYQLQLECDKLAEQVDQWSDLQVPLGETNEEFYQDIYTSQPVLPSNLPPPLPDRPPVWRPEPTRNELVEEREEPSWVCRMCTFDNHPLLNKCEQCDMPRFYDHGNAGETQDIHIRVTHHHNFSPRRTVHSWVV
ncbi:TGF-beta-activated kinase 1 and MAP3K7-binding protein 2 isoform X2 [Prorops nasuta]|uniref:TGF-beta-activated kinase 1 and MAP3K7-binding protein 2 isoform X2 n=1 Tax=Prorops nasuta TaxID=863751 RepID=UPI0034CED078